MDKNILNTVKLNLGIAVDDTSFDNQLITAINSVFMILNQIGVGADHAFRINDGSEEWDNLILDSEDIEGIKSYISLKVKKIFDPGSGALGDAEDNLISELEWRINIEVDPEEE